MRNLVLICGLILVCFSGAVSQDKSAGSVKGTVKNIDGENLTDVSIAARQNGKEIAAVKTDGKGNFLFADLKPGTYRFVFNKNGYNEGVSGDVEVKAGKTITLKRLILLVDKGALAWVRGSVFDADGRIVRGARVELSRVSGGNLTKIGERFSDLSGEFSFRLPPEAARYRLTVKFDTLTGAKEIEIDGAEVYRVAISLKN